VSFDAVVGVEITPNGFSGAVVDLNTNAITPLPQSAITIVQDTIHVIVPVSMLPSTGAASPAQYQVNMYTADGDPSLSFKNVASLVPEFRSIPVRHLAVYPYSNFPPKP
jgi:hypothetical protein